MKMKMTTDIDDKEEEVEDRMTMKMTTDVDDKEEVVEDIE